MGLTVLTALWPASRPDWLEELHQGDGPHRFWRCARISPPGSRTFVAIGAFLAGLIISESSCSDLVRGGRADEGGVHAIFFIAIGMRIDVGMVAGNILLCLGIAAVFIVTKMSSILFASYLTTMDPRSSCYLSTSMVAMGEFGFIIATLGLGAGILDLELYSTIIGAALITMIALPLLSRSAPQIYERASRRSPSWAYDYAPHGRTRAEVRGSWTSPGISPGVRQQLLLIFVDLFSSSPCSSCST